METNKSESEKKLAKLEREVKLLRTALQQQSHLQTLLEQSNEKLAEQEKIIRVERDRAEEATKAKSMFLANMSHEIRTPMNGVLGMTEILKDTSLTKDQQNYLGIIETSANNLLSIINDILDFSKIEAGKIELEKAPVRLETVINEVGDILASKAAKKNIELITYVDPDIPHLIEADHVRIRQVVLNLVGNAVKFTDQGSVFVSCEMVKQEEKLVAISFKVVDTGIGISEENKRKLFQSFTQTDDSVTRKYGGTGLGLTISKKLVDLMGGNIVVESQPGKGSEFSFEVKFPVLSQKAFYSDRLKDIKVTAVDDNPTNRLILRRYLKAFDVEAHIFHTPEGMLKDFVKKYQNNEFYDVILLDYTMPRYSGLDLVKLLNQQAKGHKSKAILLSSITDMISDKILKEIGVNLQLSKPLKVSQLYDSIYHVLFATDETSIEEHADKKEDTIQSVQYRILMAEDNLINQHVAQSVLGKLGQKADLASNGKEALKKYMENDYNVVLMDVEMPIMDGIEATEAIREYELQNKKSPALIIALTAGVSKEDKEKCLAVGMNHFVPKPFNIKHIADIFQSLAND